MLRLAGFLKAPREALHKTPRLGVDISASPPLLLGWDGVIREIGPNPGVLTPPGRIPRGSVGLVLPWDAVRQAPIRLPRQAPEAEILALAAQQVREMTGDDPVALAWDFTWQDPSDLGSGMAWLAVGTRASIEAALQAAQKLVGSPTPVLAVPAGDALLAGLSAQIAALDMESVLLVDCSDSALHVQRITGGRRTGLWNTALDDDPAGRLAALVERLDNPRPGAILLAAVKPEIQTEPLAAATGLPVFPADPWVGLDRPFGGGAYGEGEQRRAARVAGLVREGRAPMANLLPWRAARQRRQNTGLALAFLAGLALIAVMVVSRALHIEAGIERSRYVLAELAGTHEVLAAAQTETARLAALHAGLILRQGQIESARRSRAELNRLLAGLLRGGQDSPRFTGVRWENDWQKMRPEMRPIDGKGAGQAAEAGRGRLQLEGTVPDAGLLARWLEVWPHARLISLEPLEKVQGKSRFVVVIGEESSQ